MSKGLKSVLSIVASIAIPFVAAPLATAMAGTFGVTSSLGATALTAATGAGLGAAKAAVLGEDIGQGALFGGIGGGVGGYANSAGIIAGNPAAAGAGVAASTPATAGAGIGATPGISAAASTLANLTPTGIPTAGGLGAGLSGATSSIGGGLATLGGAAPLGDAFGAYTGYGNSLATMNGTFSMGDAYTPITSDAFAQYTPQTAGLDTSTAGAQQSGAQQQQATKPPEEQPGFLKQTWNNITDPKNLADLTLRAAGMLAGSAFGAEGLSAEEKALLNQQVNELRELQLKNETLFKEKIQNAQDMMGESKYFDPEYFGLQSARHAQLAGARAKQAGLRGLTGEAYTTEARRRDLNTARATGSAYDSGYATGVQGRLQTKQTANSMYPGYLDVASPSSDARWKALDAAYRRDAEQQKNIGTLFGSLTGTTKAQATQ